MIIFKIKVKLSLKMALMKLFIYQSVVIQKHGCGMKVPLLQVAAGMANTIVLMMVLLEYSYDFHIKVYMVI